MPTDDTPETIIRCSSLPEYPDCPRRWAARTLGQEIKDQGYVLRRRARMIGAIVGTGAHAGAAYTMEEKRKTGTIGNKTECEHRALETMNQEVEGEIIWDQVTPAQPHAEKQILRLVWSYRDHWAPNLKPKSVEQRLDARHPTGLKISGQQDLVVEDPAKLRDYKTGRVRRANGAQYGGYTRILRSHGQPVEAICEDYHKRMPLTKVQEPPVEIVYDVAACEQQTEIIIRSIARDLAEFRESGDTASFVANPRSMLCSNKYCGAWGTPWCTAHSPAED